MPARSIPQNLHRALDPSVLGAAVAYLSPSSRDRLRRAIELDALWLSDDVCAAIHQVPGLADDVAALRACAAAVAALEGNAHRAGSIFALADSLDPQPRLCSIPGARLDAAEVARATASRAMGGADASTRARYFLRALACSAVAGDPFAAEFPRAAERAADGAIVPIVLLHRLDAAAAGLAIDPRAAETASTFLLTRTVDPAERARLEGRRAQRPEGDDAALLTALAARRWATAAEAALGVAFATADALTAAYWLHRSTLYALAAGRTLGAVRPIVETLLARLAEVRGAPAAFIDHASDLLLAAVIDGGPETLSDDLDATAVPEFGVFRALALACAPANDGKSAPPAASPPPTTTVDPERRAALAAEEAGDWDRAAQLFEALARRLASPAERAATYARAGAIYADKLGRRTTAIEQFMVAFMATPYDPAVFHPLAALQRDAGRFRELAGTFGIAADALNERGDTAGAADLLHARIEVERDLMRDTRRAEQSRARAAARFPHDVRFTNPGSSALRETGDRVAIENTQPGAASETLHTPSAISMPRR